MEHEVTLSSEDISLPKQSLWAKLPVIGGVVGIALLALSFVLGQGEQRLFFSYLVAYVYWLTLALGGLFFVLLHYLARSGWSVVVRRLAEHVMGTLPLFALLFVPVALGLHDLYRWTHAEEVAHSPLLQHKTPYLNVEFFYLRAVFYFVVWSALAFFYWRQSTSQDEHGEIETSLKLRKWSAVSMILFGVTLTFAAFDWLMSLEPEWFSTIFGVYIFAGCVISIFSLLILMSMNLQKNGAMTRVVTEEHYHDMGKMLFGFVVFWAYIGFSQFMLIWYANIPEETFWFDLRWHHGWKPVSIFLAVAHFAVPFFFLISQPVKRSRIALPLGAVWMLLMHYVDIYWLVMPSLREAGFSPNLLDLTCWLGVGGLFLAVLGRLMSRKALVPVKDPRLAESLAFESV